MKNVYRHNEDGTTTIFVNYLDEEFEVSISTAQFEKVSSIKGTWRLWWKSSSRTYYVASTKNCKSIYLHRLIKDFPEGMQVHHIDGNGLNNTDENLIVLTLKEHAEETKKKPKEPFIGDPSLGVEVHLLSEFSEHGKRPFRFKINGIPLSIRDDLEGHLRKWITDEIMNENATDEQIYEYLYRAGYRNKDMITRHINWVRNFAHIPDPSRAQRKRVLTSKAKV